MQEEKMMILKMLEDGKITADEAVKLMDALKGGGDNKLSAVKERVNSFVKDAKPAIKKAAGAAKEVSGIAAGVAKKSMDIIGAKLTEIKNRPRNADFDGDVVVEPVHDEDTEPQDITDKVEIVESKAEEAAEAVKDKAEDIAEEIKEKAEDIAEEVKEKA